MWADNTPSTQEFSNKEELPFWQDKCPSKLTMPIRNCRTILSGALSHKMADETELLARRMLSKIYFLGKRHHSKKSETLATDVQS